MQHRILLTKYIKMSKGSFILIVYSDIDIVTEKCWTQVWIFSFAGTTTEQSDLAAKLDQMQELVRQKNKVELKLSQQLQDIKKELEKERETFRAELDERESRERALEVGKRQLETQLTQVDRENYESLQELGLLQERLQERIRVEGELREEKSKLLTVIKEKEGELAKERSELTEKLQQHEQVIEVNLAYCCLG